MLQKKWFFLRYGIALLVVIGGLPLAGLAQTQPTVLAELFRNINCSNCQVPDNEYEAYMSTHPGIVLINYHNSTGDPQDPFYTASLPASNDRDLFYGGPLNDPDAFIDGISAGAGQQNEPAWEAITNAALSKPLNAINATVYYGPNGIDTISFILQPHKTVIVYVAIKESQLLYVNSEKYGRPSDDLWNDVFRTMLPTPNGSTAFTGTKSFNIIFDPSNYPFNGNEQNMTAVIFTQDANSSTKQAEALGVVSLAQSSAVTERNTASNRLIIPANPIRQQGHIGIELQSSSDVQLTLSDLLGRQVRTLVDGRMPAGQTSVELEGSGLAAGCYVAHLTVDGREAGHAMLVIEQ